MKSKIYKYIFWLGLLLAIVVTAAAFAANLSGAWLGSPASVGQLVTTMIYIAFWCVFTWLSVRLKSLRKIVFVISLLTLISATISFVCVATNQGFVIEALMSIFVSVPFYGVRNFTNWEVLYGGAFVISLVWFIFAVWQLRKDKNLEGRTWSVVKTWEKETDAE